MSDKTLDEYFYDWETHVFGYGYGSGECHIIPALQKIMELVPESGCYNYEEFEKSLSPVVAWLFINILCKNNIFEYGTSPRYGWLTESGKELKIYLKGMSEFNSPDVDYNYCYPDHCNCDLEEGMKCDNPFWRS